MNCIKCKTKLGFLSNYGTDDCPLCFDCELIERKKRNVDLKKTEEKSIIDQCIHENNKSDQIKSEFSETAILSTDDEFEDYSDKHVICNACKKNLQNGDENYGSKGHPLCMDCKKTSNVHCVRNGIKVFSVSFTLFLSFCFGIGSILVFIDSPRIWRDEGFVPVSPVAGLLVGMVMSMVGGLISLVTLLVPDSNRYRGYSICSLIINSLIPIFFIGFMIFSGIR